jgi:4-alpha-glucanotransferase
MNETMLARLAALAGIEPSWRDVHGVWHEVSDATLRAVLAATGVAAATDAEVEAALAAIASETSDLPALLTARVGQPVAIDGDFTVALEQGGEIAGHGSVTIDQPGYHTLIRDGRATTLAVAPPRCPPVPDGRPWGIAVQLYGLRREGDGGIGDFPALAQFVEAATRHGADAVAISPMHAQFSADVSRYSPYAPSSRIMTNVLHAEAGADAELEALEYVDWPAAAKARLARLRARFDAGVDADELAAFRAERGEKLEAHARFEALHAHFYGADPGLWHWRSWPAEYQHPAQPAVQAFADAHHAEVAFHAWLQMQADHGLRDAHAAALAAGMRIGLVSDLAVGTDGGGSHAWSRQDEMMIGLAIGAPPDLWNRAGQNWGIGAFSPLGLRLNGYAAFLEMLRAALRHAGGVRIDHVMGLQRLWVVPDGVSAAEGAYLTFPIDDMLRLVALEAHRHDAIVLGEDLGTVPDGFHGRLIGNNMLGLRVLWFERDDDRLRPPEVWSPNAVAMTSTHDLPTVAGWWRGRDLDWREKMGWDSDPGAFRAARERDRALFWQAFRDSRAATGDMPPPHDTWPAVAAALGHVARTACQLVLLPLEDVLALDEQPNLPTTQNEHPNWRRRMPGPAATLLDDPVVAGRLAAFRATRTAQ